MHCIYSPIVGIVVTISPSFSLYSIVVFPAASNPVSIILNIIIDYRGYDMIYGIIIISTMTEVHTIYSTT